MKQGTKMEIQTKSLLELEGI